MIKYKKVYIDLTKEEKHLCWICSELTSCMYSLGFIRPITTSMCRLFTDLQYNGCIHVNQITDLKKFYKELTDFSIDIGERYGDLECGADRLKMLKGIIDKIDKEFEK